MELTYADLSNGIRKIDLNGRMDVEGVASIEMRFTALTATQSASVVVDLANVEFMSSIGLATLVRNAKAVRLRGGNLVILNPRANVAAVLASTRIDQVILVCDDMAAARMALESPPAAAR